MWLSQIQCNMWLINENICDWIYKNRPYWHKKWNVIYCWLLNLTLALPKNTNHIAIDGQVCFHWRLIADPVKPPWCNTGSVGPVGGTNKDVTGARLLTTTVSTCPVDWVPFCHSLKTQHCCLCPYGSFSPPLATHPPPPPTPPPSCPPTPPPPAHPPPITCHSWYYSCYEKSCSKTSSVS